MKNQRLKSNINQLLLFRSSSVKDANPVKTKKSNTLESPFLIPNPIETRSVLWKNRSTKKRLWPYHPFLMPNLLLLILNKEKQGEGDSSNVLMRQYANLLISPIYFTDSIYFAECQIILIRQGGMCPLFQILQELYQLFHRKQNYYIPWD